MASLGIEYEANLSVYPVGRPCGRRKTTWLDRKRYLCKKHPPQPKETIRPSLPRPTCPGSFHNVQECSVVVGEGSFHSPYFLRNTKILKRGLYMAVVFGNEHFLDLEGESLHTECRHARPITWKFNLKTIERHERAPYFPFGALIKGRET